MPYLTIETVSHYDTVRGRTTKAQEAVRFTDIPFRIGKRANLAHTVGLKFVKSLGIDHSRTVSYVGVFDNERRLLAAWRVMPDSIYGFTGTNDKHPMLGGRSMFYSR